MEKKFWTLTVANTKSGATHHIRVELDREPSDLEAWRLVKERLERDHGVHFDLVDIHRYSKNKTKELLEFQGWSLLGIEVDK